MLLPSTVCDVKVESFNTLEFCSQLGHIKVDFSIQELSTILRFPSELLSKCNAEFGSHPTVPEDLFCAFMVAFFQLTLYNN